MNKKPAAFYLKILLLSLFILFSLVLVVEGFYYWRLTQKASPSTNSQKLTAEEPSPLEQPTASQEFAATENVDVYSFPEGEKLGYFVPGQKFILTGEEAGSWIQVTDIKKEHLLWIKKDSPYQPVNE